MTTFGTFALVHGGLVLASRGGAAAGGRPCGPHTEPCRPGERAHLLNPTVDLETRVAEVVRLLDGDDLGETVLVGHGYGRMVVAGAADRVARRLAHFVFPDAFVPANGQALLDLLRPERRELDRRQAREMGDGWTVPPPPPQVLGMTDTARASWLVSMPTPQPLRTFEQPVRLTASAPNTLPRTYVHCTAEPLAPSFAPFAERFRSAPGWRSHTLSTGHGAMLIAPDDVATRLLGLRPT